MKKVLVIQTAFIGDVILATSFIETLRRELGKDAVIDVLVRNGNEVLLDGHSEVNQVLVWNKKENKYSNLFALAKKIRKAEYAVVFNLQRFASTGFLTWRSKAKAKVGFKTNPLSFLLTHKVPHQIGNGRHEVERNVDLLSEYLGKKGIEPASLSLYPSNKEKEKVKRIINDASDFLVMAPSSVWFTKQLPAEKWVELIQLHSAENIYLIGAPGDFDFLQSLISNAGTNNCENLAGKLSLLESAALIGEAKRTYVNDSAPLHLASAMNAPVTAFFCSTVPAFGFGPLSQDAKVVETKKELSCRPCGLHGFKACPKGHFECGKGIQLG